MSTLALEGTDGREDKCKTELVAVIRGRFSAYKERYPELSDVSIRGAIIDDYLQETESKTKKTKKTYVAEVVKPVGDLPSGLTGSIADIENKKRIDALKKIANSRKPPEERLKLITSALAELSIDPDEYYSQLPKLHTKESESERLKAEMLKKYIASQQVYGKLSNVIGMPAEAADKISVIKEMLKDASL